MNCPKCGNDLGYPEGEHVECRRCGWVRAHRVTKPRMLFGAELFSGRELTMHLVLSIVFMAAPYIIVVFLIPWLATRDTRYLLLIPPSSAQWFSRHYWQILIGYLALAAIFNPVPDPDAPEIHSNPIDEFLLISAVVLLPGKWLFLSLYSLIFNRRKS